MYKRQNRAKFARYLLAGQIGRLTEPLLGLVGRALDDLENSGLERFDRRDVVREAIGFLESACQPIGTEVQVRARDVTAEEKPGWVREMR